MTRALVFYLYGPENAGDLAICLGTIGFLRRRGVDVTMVSRFDAAAPDFVASRDVVRARYPEVEVVPGTFALDRSAGRASVMTQYVAGAAKLLLRVGDARIAALVERADVVLFNGGNLLRCASATDAIRLEALFHPIRMARRMGKRVVCLPQSTATVAPRWRRFLGSKLALFDEVFVREGASLERLRSLYPDLPFAKSTDMAFFMDDSEDSPRTSGSRAAMVVRGTGIGDIGELAETRQDELLGAFAGFAVAHPELAYTVVVQTKKDRALSERLVALLPNGAELVEEHDPFRLLSIYKDMDVTLSMRLHAAILSLRAGTPVVGMFDREWGLKNIGVMSDYGMGYSDCAEGLLDEYRRVVEEFDPGGLKDSIARYEAELADALGFSLEAPDQRFTER